MLVLSRRVGDSITINDNVVVKILAIHGNYIELGVIADKEVAVYRQELLSDEFKAAEA